MGWGKMYKGSYWIVSPASLSGISFDTRELTEEKGGRKVKINRKKSRG